MMIIRDPFISVLRVNLFKDSRKPFLDLLQANGIAHKELLPKLNTPMAAGFVVEILQGSAPWAASLAAVVCAFLKNRRSRKVMVTMKDGSTVNCEGIGEPEIARVLEHAKDMMAIETKSET